MRVNHHPSCECDLCFADDIDAFVTMSRRARERRSPLASLPGWDHAEKLAREVGELNRELIEAAE